MINSSVRILVCNKFLVKVLLSLIFFGLLDFFVGIAFEIVYVLNIYFALQGLKTRKRGKAIATIIITIISIIIMILNIIV